MKFNIVGPPGKNPFSHPGQTHYCPLEKSFPRSCSDALY